jgi:iron complex outermembrane recepter protein
MARKMTTSAQPVSRLSPVARAVLFSLLAPSISFAQTTAPEKTDPNAPAKPAAEAAATNEAAPAKIETIVVTSRKRTEVLQTVPVAVSAFNAESLQRANIENAADIQFSVPSAILVGGDTFTIRGIGNGSLGGDAGVGVFLNGASIAAVPQDQFYDLERIEILRGPQGTLFGRNTTGGAASVFTKRPTRAFSGDASLETGNYKETKFNGALNVPLSDNLTQRFAGYVYKRDGFTKNVHTGNKIDGRDQYGFRSSTRLLIGENGELNMMLGVYNEDSTRTRETKRLCKADAVLGCSPNELGFDSPAATATILNTLTRAFTPFPAGGNIYAGAPNPQNPREVAADTDPRFTMDQKYATIEYSHDIGNHSLTYVGGYSTFETEQNTDWDNAALPFRFTRPITYYINRDTQLTTDQLIATDSFTSNSRTYSHEFRVASRYSGMFNFTAGGFYLSNSGRFGFEAWHPGIEAFQRVQGRPQESWFVNTKGRGTLDAKALFGEANFKLNSQLRLAVGARYTKEDRFSASRNIVLAAPTPEREATSNDSKGTGRVTLDYAINPQSFLYGSVATGYKGGGFNIGNVTNPTFDPEVVRAYEMGLKNTLLNGTLQANFTVFYNDYKGLQLGQRVNGTVRTSNADSITKGLEMEFNWLPTRSVLLDANVSFLNTRIGEFFTVDPANPGQSLTATTPQVAVNLQGKLLPYSPRSKYKIGGQHTLPLGANGWQMISRLDYLWQGEYFAREFNTPTDRITPWGVTNLMVRFVNPNKRMQFKVYAKNLADKNNITRIVVEDALLGSYRNARYLDPRTVGVAFEYKF